MSQLTDELFAVNLRKVLQAHGHLPAFEAALKGESEEFAVKLENQPYQPLSIEVLAPCMNYFNMPAVAVSHTFIQNDDLMRDPEIVFAVKPEGWVPYEITQDPMGVYNSAFDADGQFQESISRSIRQLAKMWARNLISQGWAGEQVRETQSIKPKL